MNKEVIYIDAEDDITSLVGKIKVSDKKIVALVPSKQVALLRSVVNLRLLDRASKRYGKRLVVVSGDKILKGLAAIVKMPLAQDLQSKPSVPKLDVLDIDNGEDVIDGSNLAVGEHAASVGLGDQSSRDDALDSLTIDEAEEAHQKTKEAAGRQAKKSRVPDFNTFRKRLLIIGLGLILLIAAIVWAVIFAPHATIDITARTTENDISQQVVIKANSQTSAQDMEIKGDIKSGSQDISSDFDATGQKNVGDKATGTVTMTACMTTPMPPQPIAAGTKISAGSNSYTTNSQATFSFDQVTGGCINYVSNAVSISADDPGIAGNEADGTTFSVTGNSNVTATGSASGGTDKITTVVTADDIAKAIKAAQDSFDQNTARNDLKSQFGDGYIVLPDSFSVDASGLKSSVDVGSEVKGNSPQIVGKITYQMYAISKDELKSYLTAVATSQFENPDRQKVYDSGVNGATLSNVQLSKDSVTATLTAKAKIGPTIDPSVVKETARGLKQGEVEAELKQINGIDTVKVHYSPFWVNIVPNDVNKISVDFKVND